MASTLFHLSCCQEIDLVCWNDIFQAVGNDDHILFPGKCLNVFHNDGFAFHVDIAGCLIENINILVSYQVHSQCQTLFLTTRNVACILGDHLIQPTVFLDKIPEIYFFQSFLHLGFGCFRYCEQEVVSYRIVKNIGIVADHCNMTVKITSGQFFQRNSAHKYLSH